MKPESQTDHIALLALMICGTLMKRLNELDQLDEATKRRLQRLVSAVRIHAKNHGSTDLNILFDNISFSLSDEGKTA